MGNNLLALFSYAVSAELYLSLSIDALGKVKLSLTKQEDNRECVITEVRTNEGFPVETRLENAAGALLSRINEL